jgi:hypothetical protein
MASLTKHADSIYQDKNTYWYLNTCLQSNTQTTIRRGNNSLLFTYVVINLNDGKNKILQRTCWIGETADNISGSRWLNCQWKSLKSSTIGYNTCQVRREKGGRLIYGSTNFDQLFETWKRGWTYTWDWFIDGNTTLQRQSD